jgi:hypothetical protein
MFDCSGPSDNMKDFRLTFVLDKVQVLPSVNAFEALFASSTGANRLISASKQIGLFLFSAIFSAVIC